MLRLSTACAAALLLLSSNVAHALNEITIEGQDFVDKTTNQRLVVLGVDYQPGGQSAYNPATGKDALSDGKACLRDAAILQSLGVNTIRVYNVAPEINHDACMSVFNVAGIYVILDVNAPFAGESLDRGDPADSYNTGYLNRTFGMVESFKNFPNLLGFFAANEVVNDMITSKDDPPYIRAVQRDIKEYIANHANRSIPVGYSAADVRPILQDTWEYMTCAINGDADSDKSRSDFFGLNSYSWCGDVNTFQTSTYDKLAAMFQSSSVPVFFSEYGCNQVKPRTFPEVAALYGPQMTMLSGGLVYEYSEETDDYGLININDNSSVSLRIDFTNLQAQYNKLDLKLLQSPNTTAEDITPPKCSSSLITSGSFSTSWNLPSTPSGAQELIKNGVPGASALQGHLVDVTDLNCPVAVYSPSGVELPQFKITAVSSQNAPSGNSTNATSSSTSSKKSAAATVGAGETGAMLAMVFAMAVALFSA